MTHTLILATDAYRMVDALKYYAASLDAEGNESMAGNYRDAAERIEMTERVGNGLISVSNFDLHSAQVSVIMLMTAAYEAAEAARDEAARLSYLGKRYEDFMGAFTA